MSGWNPLDHLEEVEYLASLGLSEKQIASKLNVHPEQIRYSRKQNAQFEAAFQKGLNETIIVATEQLKRLINSGDFKAIKFFLEKKAGWTDQVSLAITPPNRNSFTLKQIKKEEEKIGPSDV